MKIYGLVALLLCGANAIAAIRTELVEYNDGDAILEGLLTYDSETAGKRPAVLIVHQWRGITEYERQRAEMLAKMGYIAFAVDIYGKGVRPQTSAQAGAEAGRWKKDREALRKRVRAGLDWLRKQEQVDPERIAAIGYCFGGTTVMELARSGAELKGVVSFHGGLDSRNPADGANIKTKVLALHGADDPFVSAKDLADFENEMRAGKVDWQLVKYGGAVHSFTDWKAGNDTASGAAYNASADRRSWEAMRQFFVELFGK